MVAQGDRTLDLNFSPSAFQSYTFNVHEPISVIEPNGCSAGQLQGLVTGAQHWNFDPAHSFPADAELAGFREGRKPRLLYRSLAVDRSPEKALEREIF